MNEKKICFIIHNDNKMSYSDNVEYIKALNVPRGMEAECLTVESDQSKFEAYNEGMYASDAKYKVYIGYNTYYASQYPELNREGKLDYNLTRESAPEYKLVLKKAGRL